MSETSWEELYQKGDTRWDKGEPSPGLVDFLEQHPELPRGRVLVPGCGMGHDVRAWAQAGFEATGLDLAPSAIRHSREKTAAAGLSAEYCLEDFLTAPLPAFDWLFEHTLFCAIDPSRRGDYAKAAARVLTPDGRFLAIFYMLPVDEEGPPFGSTRESIRAQFEPYFELLSDWVPRSYSNRTGLEWMTLWRKRPGLSA